MKLRSIIFIGAFILSGCGGTVSTPQAPIHYYTNDCTQDTATSVMAAQKALDSLKNDLDYEEEMSPPKDDTALNQLKEQRLNISVVESLLGNAKETLFHISGEKVELHPDALDSVAYNTSKALDIISSIESDINSKHYYGWTITQRLVLDAQLLLAHADFASKTKACQ